MNVGDILNGHIKELLNLGEDLSKNRLQICYSCPLYSKKLGGLCNDKLWLNINTGDVNTFLELKQIQNVEEQIGLQIKQPMEEQNGNDKNEWNNNF